MTSRELEDWLAARVAAELGVTPDEVDRDEAFAEFGLDSLRAVALTGELEALLGRKLPATLLWDHPTIERLSEHLGAA